MALDAEMVAPGSPPRPQGTLAPYNLRTPSARIRRLWVMSRGGLVEVDLTGK